MEEPLMMLKFEDEEEMWWERLPWLSKVVPIKKMKGRENEKAREEREVGSRAKNSSSKGNEKWRVVKVVRAKSVRKAGGEENLMETGRLVQLKLFQLWGKRMVALKMKEKLSGLRDCWEKGQSSEGLGRAYSDGHSRPPCFGLDGVDCRPSLGLSYEQPSERTVMVMRKGVILALW
ncbi:hypothetical protein CK203_077942 [Vitis vinifera]|uniref:Uncharacterized protein n=1 Tax=Vitis vinifera TaxID=29760 RepID=A0A438EAU2_VITVI|nr:hypothetical protein CK203_077942 [Vitis vinifera]